MTVSDQPSKFSIRICTLMGGAKNAIESGKPEVINLGLKLSLTEVALPCLLFIRNK